MRKRIVLGILACLALSASTARAKCEDAVALWYHYKYTVPTQVASLLDIAVEDKTIKGYKIDSIKYLGSGSMADTYAVTVTLPDGKEVSAVVKMVGGAFRSSSTGLVDPSDLFLGGLTIAGAMEFQEKAYDRTKTATDPTIKVPAVIGGISVDGASVAYLSEAAPGQMYDAFKASVGETSERLKAVDKKIADGAAMLKGTKDKMGIVDTDSNTGQNVIVQPGDGTAGKDTVWLIDFNAYRDARASDFP